MGALARPDPPPSRPPTFRLSSLKPSSNPLTPRFASTSPPPGGYNFSIYKVPAGVTAATYVKDRVLVGRADPSGFVNDQQPSWRP